jgi:hypothetical protein
MKKRLILSLAIALLLVAILAVPAVAAETSTTASVEVGETISITLSDPSSDGINFGPVTANGSTYGDIDQSEGTPAIQIVVVADTNVNVNIGIKGSTTDALALSYWQYSSNYTQNDIAGLTTSYAGVYTDKGPGTYGFYHWITVPTNTPAGTYTANISYEAVKTGDPFS